MDLRSLAEVVASPKSTIDPAPYFDRETMIAVLQMLVDERRGAWLSAGEAAAILLQLRRGQVAEASK